MSQTVRLWVGHAYERDVRLRFSNGERTDALAVDREASSSAPSASR
jgi:hypothetical protein